MAQLKQKIVAATAVVLLATLSWAVAFIATKRIEEHNTPISYEALQPNELDVLGCGSSTTEKYDVSRDLRLYNVHKCNVPSKDKLLNTRTRGNWHMLEQFVLDEDEDSSSCKAANITLCNARGRLFQYFKVGEENHSVESVECVDEVNLSNEENDCNSDIIYFEGNNNTTRYYALFVDMYDLDDEYGESRDDDILSYALEYECLDDINDCYVSSP